jgi:hypothetical protein
MEVLSAACNRGKAPVSPASLMPPRCTMVAGIAFARQRFLW